MKLLTVLFQIGNYWPHQSKTPTMNKIFSVLILPFILLLGACSTSGLEVTGKEYVYPRFQAEWLEPTLKAPVPSEPVTNRELYRFILGQEEALDRCNAKVEYTRKSYEDFIKNLPTDK